MTGSDAGISRAIALADGGLDDLPTASSAIDDLAHTLGGVDVVCELRGHAQFTAVIEMDFDTWREVLSVDLGGSFVCAQDAAQHMLYAGRGTRIITITSVHEHAPRVGAAPYCAAKAGAGALTKVLALELAEHEIAVNSVAPGEASTPMTGQLDADPKEHRRPGVPLGRTGDAPEAAASFLATPAAAYITGDSLVVDDGMLLTDRRRRPPSATTTRGNP